MKMVKVGPMLLLGLFLGVFIASVADADNDPPEKAEVDTRWEEKADKDNDGVIERNEWNHWKKRHNNYKHKHHKYKDKDNNPPGKKGGPGTNWENPPGPKGGPGASPDRPARKR